MNKTQQTNNMEPEKKDVWEELDFFTKDMVIGILSGDKNSPVFVNNDLEMPRLKNFIRTHFISKEDVADKIKIKFNGYGGRLGFTQSDLLDLLTQEK